MTKEDTYWRILISRIGTRDDTSHAPACITHVITLGLRTGSIRVASRATDSKGLTLIRVVDRLRLTPVHVSSVAHTARTAHMPAFHLVRFFC